MRDYDGPLSFYEDQLFLVGITREEFDIRNYVGCTAVELQNLVDYAIKIHNKKGGLNEN